MSGTAATVSFSSAASDVARFECRVDGDAYATCTSPKQFTALAEGAHTVSVRAVDNAGNVGAADTKTFTVDTIAPDTSITGAPVSGSTATVSFSSPASDVARFECRLDGGTYATCTSPKQFSALTEGEHTVSVRAVDNAGNTGAADSKTFTVDTTAPSASISNVQVSGSTATVSFSSAASDVARFECRVDAGAFATCTSPKQFTALAEGAHTAYVRAVDNVGNVGVADSKTFTVDTIAPNTSITGAPVSGSSATVSFSSAASDVARFECRLDGGTYATCTSPKQFTGLAEGSHTVSVRAVDNAGNTGVADSRTFTVDTTAPSTSISDVQVTGSTATARVFFSSPASDVARFECRVDAGAFATCTSPKQYTGLAGGAHTAYVRAVDNAGNTGVADSKAFSVDTTAPTTSISDVQVSGATATVSFSSPASDVARFECRVDGDAFAACTSPKQFTALTDGAHTAYVRTVDNDGNTGAADSKAFSVDTTAPSTSISDVQVSGTAATVSFSSPASDVARFECRVDGDAYATCTSPMQLTGLADGAHTISVRAVDHAGNTGTCGHQGLHRRRPPIDAGTVGGTGALRCRQRRGEHG